MVGKMQIYNSIDEVKQNAKIVASFGTFDGIHRGHRYLIDTAKSIAKQKNAKVLVYTFTNIPKMFTEKLESLQILSEEDKILLFEMIGIDYLLMEKFNDKIRELDNVSFIKRLKDRLNITDIVVGSDFRFGKNAIGDVDWLKEHEEEFAFKLHVQNLLVHEDIRISSSKIREFLKNAELEKLKNLLGRFHFVKSKVIRGRKIGRTIGFPTANLLIDKRYAKLANGVYSTLILYEDKLYFSITNVGFKPTFSDYTMSIESFIFEFDKDIYGKTIRVFFLEKIRDTQKFSGINELKVAISNDKNYVLKNLEKYKTDIKNCDLLSKFEIISWYFN